MTLSDGECDQAVEALDSNMAHYLSDAAPDALVELRATLDAGGSWELSVGQAAALRIALEARCEEIEGDLAEAGTEAWLAHATRCLADARARRSSERARQRSVALRTLETWTESMIALATPERVW